MCQRLMNTRSSCSLSLTRRQMQQALQAWGLQREASDLSPPAPPEKALAQAQVCTFSGLSLGLSISSYPVS